MSDYSKHNHVHCWEDKNPPCGQKIEHLKCCLCEELNPKVAMTPSKNLREEFGEKFGFGYVDPLHHSVNEIIRDIHLEFCAHREALVREHMVNRFLSWKLPEDFSPDGGITFKKEFNENTEFPMKHEPTGTNLFTATQARKMVEYMLDTSSLTPSNHNEN